MQLDRRDETTLANGRWSGKRLLFPRITYLVGKMGGMDRAKPSNRRQLHSCPRTESKSPLFISLGVHTFSRVKSVVTFFQPSTELRNGSMARFWGLQGSKLHLAIWAEAWIGVMIFGYNQASAGGVLADFTFNEQFPRMDTLTTTGSLQSYNAKIQGKVSTYIRNTI